MLDSTRTQKLFIQYLKIACLSARMSKIPSWHLLAQSLHKKQQNKKHNMFKVKKKDARVTSANCIFISIDIGLVSFFVNFGHISHRFLIFLSQTLNR